MTLSLTRFATAIALLALAPSVASADFAAATKAYGRLLSTYVTPRGVKYDAWRASGVDLKTISEVVSLYRNTDTRPLSPNEKKALYINLYNAKVLELVLLSHPRNSITELSKGPRAFEIFSRDAFAFDGKTLSLNDLEKKLRDEFKDPRTHFAVNCASKSCPPIRAEPYAAETLDVQLDDATRSYLARPGSVEVTTEGGRAKITTVKIFDWYADDFKVTGGALGFLVKYGPQAAVDAIAAGKTKLDFAEYDWSLNAAK